MIEMPTVPHTAGEKPSDGPARDDALRRQAVQLESLLFAELLRVSGTGMPSLDGGEETQFDSFLRQAHGEAVAGAGQTGLAEAIFRSLSRNAEAADLSVSSGEAAADT